MATSIPAVQGTNINHAVLIDLDLDGTMYYISSAYDSVTYNSNDYTQQQWRRRRSSNYARRPNKHVSTNGQADTIHEQCSQRPARTVTQANSLLHQ